MKHGGNFPNAVFGRFFSGILKVPLRVLFPVLLICLYSASGLPGLGGLRAMAEDLVAECRIEIYPDAEEYSVKKTYIGGTPSVAETSYSVDYSRSSGTKTPGKSYTYTLTIKATDGYEFTEDCAVVVVGAVALEVTSRSSSKIQVKATTYPYYVFPLVSNVRESGKNITWDKVDYASGYEVVIKYDDDGEEKTAKRSTGSSKVDISSYNTKKRSVTGIGIRAKASGASEGFFAQNDYVDETGDITDVGEETVNGDYSFNPPIARTNAPASAASSGSGASSNASSSTAVTGVDGGPGVGGAAEIAENWKEDGGNWYYELEGQRQTGWINPINNDRYLLAEDGRLLTGWQLSGGYYYYLDPDPGEDGSLGKMLTGWQEVGGKWYYLNPSPVGYPYGALYVNTQTPDGFTVDENGVWQG